MRIHLVIHRDQKILEIQNTSTCHAQIFEDEMLCLKSIDE